LHDLENCCYDFFELLTLIWRAGLVGVIVHGEGAYSITCRDELCQTDERNRPTELIQLCGGLKRTLKERSLLSYPGLVR
jgi:hypothetical protein